MTASFLLRVSLRPPKVSQKADHARFKRTWAASCKIVRRQHLGAETLAY